MVPKLIEMVVFFSLLDPQASVLIKELGHDEWENREKASAALIKMDERPIRLLRIAMNSDDAEVRRRAKRIVEKYEGTLFPTKYKKMPWIDHLPKDFKGRNKALKDHLLQYKENHQWDNTGEYTPFRWATREFIVEYSRSGHSRKECVKLLDKMVESEEHWIEAQKAKNGGRYYPYKPFPLIEIE